MNQLLSSEEWWSLARRGEAEKKFSPIVVSAFYDAIEESKVDSVRIRDEEIPLPNRDDGFARVLLVGPTGRGKTTLLRHFIGTHPRTERFPSTSTAKTTISDIEIITRGTGFRAVVTFFSEAATRTAIHECVLDACTTALNGASEERLATDCSTIAIRNSDSASPWDNGVPVRPASRTRTGISGINLSAST